MSSIRNSFEIMICLSLRVKMDHAKLEQTKPARREGSLEMTKAGHYQAGKILFGRGIG